MIDYKIKHGDFEGIAAVSEENLEIYINHAKDCAWCENRSKAVGYEEACKDCEREGKKNCPIDSDIGDSVDFLRNSYQGISYNEKPAEEYSHHGSLEYRIKRECPFCEQRLKLGYEYDVCTKHGTNPEVFTSSCHPTESCVTNRYAF